MSEGPVSAHRTMQAAAGDAASKDIEARLGVQLPDEPRWVEAHGLCGEPDSWVQRWSGGALVGNDRATLAVLVNGGDALEPAIAAWRSVVAERPGLTLLCAEAAAAARLAAATPGHRARPATLHVLSEPLEPMALEVALLSPADSLEHVPRPLRDELTTALATASPAGRVWAVWVEGQPVSFAFASWRSPRWFDVSVETLPGFRQLGLGEMVARALILDEAARDRAPVWGALDDNRASLRLAARLGFVACAQLWVIAP